MEEKNTLEVTCDGKTVFSSRGKWLYPLFELEEFLVNSSCNAEKSVIKDKIVGKASAMLIRRMGFKKAEAGILSIPAKDIFKKSGIDFTYTTLVELISCKTEMLLKDIEDDEEAYEILKKRAGI